MSRGHDDVRKAAREKAERALRTARLSLEDGDADYDTLTRFDTAAAADLLRDAETFVEAVDVLMQNLEAGT